MGEGGRGDAETRAILEKINAEIIVVEGTGLKENRVFQFQCSLRC